MYAKYGKQQRKLQDNNKNASYDIFPARKDISAADSFLSHKNLFKVDTRRDIPWEIVPETRPSAQF